VGAMWLCGQYEKTDTVHISEKNGNKDLTVSYGS
jgi:hypothetical protein